MNAQQLDRWAFSVPEVGGLLGISRSQAYVLVKSGVLPSIRLGKCVRVPSEALQAWLREQQAAAVNGEI
jgi:prophage regulatory protein